VVRTSVRLERGARLPAAPAASTDTARSGRKRPARWTARRARSRRPRPSRGEVLISWPGRWSSRVALPTSRSVLRAGRRPLLFHGHRRLTVAGRPGGRLQRPRERPLRHRPFVRRRQRRRHTRDPIHRLREPQRPMRRHPHHQCPHLTLRPRIPSRLLSTSTTPPSSSTSARGPRGPTAGGCGVRGWVADGERLVDAVAQIAERISETANPMATSEPVRTRSTSYDSGSMVSVIIARSAPAAKP
jgi:hypothetical protein